MPFNITPRGYEVPDSDEDALVPEHFLKAVAAIDSDISAQLVTIGENISATNFAKAATQLPSTSLDLVYKPGAYSLGAPYPTGYSGSPVGNTTASVLVVYSAPGGGTWAVQELYQYGSAPRRWWRVSRTTSGAWNPWQEYGGGGGTIARPEGGGHALRVQALKDAYPLTSTGGKGAVVMRYDHGLTTVKNTILPLHTTHNLPMYVAMNSRLWGEAENSGATQEEVKGWVASRRVEIGNHTSDHKDRNTQAGIYDTVVNGRRELEQQLGITVHGFTVPGVTEYNSFEGFSGDLNGYTSTYMGAVVLSNHGITSGSITDRYRPLDGVVRQGSNHVTVEKLTFEQVKAVVDMAISKKAAVTLMLHPRNLGLTGYMPTDTLSQVLAYIRGKIDAGELADISYYQSHHAAL